MLGLLRIPTLEAYALVVVSVDIAFRYSLLVLFRASVRRRRTEASQFLELRAETRACCQAVARGESERPPQAD